MSIPTFSKDMLRLYLDLQVIIAVYSPEHIDHLRAEAGRDEFSPKELMAHFAGLQDDNGAQLFREEYRRLFMENWENIESSYNRWLAGERYLHSPSTFESALFFFASTGLFRLKGEMIPQIMANLDQILPKTPVA